ncbi:MAG: hypothetical protein P1V36_05180 [Planctomycetota bacterium]|nr:hypothetical protein [Planctomycetota bacterium]
MSSRFKIALSLVGALALACVLVVVLRDPPQASSQDGFELEGDDLGTGSGGGTDTADNPRLEGTGDAAAKGARVGPDGGGSLVNARDPSGIDYSDPEVREAELRRLLGQGSVDWQGVAKIVGLMEEPIPQELRAAFLNGLTVGPRRNQAMFAFAVLRDESFVEDLFTLLDDTGVVRGARTAVLSALWQMPGGDRDAIVRQLESRLSGDVVKDQQLLHAANRRGGPEAARALSEYLQTLSNPRQVPPHILRSLDLTDRQTAEVFAASLGEVKSPKVLKAMITAASQPGAREMVQPLQALDRDGMPDDVRQQVLDAMGRIGDTASVDYLLRKAEEPGIFGDRAVQAIGSLNTSARGVAGVLAKALDGSANNPRPRKYKKSLLIALGNSKSVETMRVVAKTLDDGDAEVRLAAVEAMGRMGHRSRGYVDKLGSMYDSGGESEKRRVAIALGSIGGEDSIKQMRRMLKGERLNPSLKQTLLMGMRAAQRQLEDERKASGSR